MAKFTLRVLTAIASLSVPAIAAAHGGNNDPNAVHACINTGSNLVRIVGATESCRPSEIAAHWSLQGAPGAPGLNGTNGINGTNGTDGINGTNGIDGTSVTFVDYFSGNQGGCANGGIIYAAGNPPVNAYVCNGLNATADSRAFRYMTFDTYLEACCWNADNNPALFGGVHPSSWTDNNAVAVQMSGSAEVLQALFVRKMYPGSNALVSSERWSDSSSTNGKVTAVLIRIKNSTAAAIDWQPSFYFTAYSGWSERASVALNGYHIWHSMGDHYSNSTASVLLSLPPNQTSTVIFVVPSSPPWNAGSVRYRMNFFAFYNNSLNLPAGLSFVDDLDRLTGNLW